MGTPDFARDSLDKLYKSGKYDICGVVTTPDRPAGRGMKLVESDVKKYAVENGLKVYQPEKISNNNEFKDEIRALNPDLVCVVSYGVILPKSFLNIPKLGCINVHPSMLPKYRGSAPIQWAVLNGDETTGVTIMYLNEKMDAGDIIMQKEVKIDPDETTGELWDRLSLIGADLLLEVVEKLEDGSATRTKQPEEFTLAPMLDRAISKINWNELSGLEIKNLARGLNPFMGAYSFLNGKKVKFWKVQLIEENNFNELTNGLEHINFEEAKNGEILLADSKKGLYVRSKDKIVSVLEIQGENAKRMSIGDFLRGNKLNIGEIFE